MSSSSGAGASDAGTFPVCGFKQAAFDGYLDGQLLQTSIDRLGTGFSGEAFQIIMTYGGRVELFTPTSFFNNGVLKTNVTLPVTGVFGIPTPPLVPADWFCAGAGSSVTLGDSGSDPVNYTLDSITKLQACGCSPVSGTITLCNSTDVSVCNQGQTSLTGTLDGAAIDWTSAVSSSGYSSDLVVTRLKKRGFLSVDVLNGAIINGVFMVPEGYPGAGTVYCTKSGTFIEGPTDGFKITISSLSLLGTCPTSAAAGGPVLACTD